MEDFNYKKGEGIKISFSYTDEFNQTTRLDRTFSKAVTEEDGSFDLLVHEFKHFMGTMFLESLVDKIKIEE